ncbi:MAG TPA: DUF3105 domain-containing protein [Actinomycetota bacterium]|nr:DUF3105 domain-containing protein [Actinomycetota bacterium]
MAKKKRRRKAAARAAKRAAPVDVAAGQEEQAPVVDTERPSHRAERKEQARRERERRIKQARRAARLRRARRWGILAGIAAVIGAIVYVSTRPSEVEVRAAEAATRLGCDEIQTAEDVPSEHTEPFAVGQNGQPANVGNHNASTLPPEPDVYEQPIPEPQAIHNLEHGYVILYYQAEGEQALSDETREELADLAEAEEKVLLAPYDGLREDTGLALTAWRKLQMCPAPENPDDAVSVARGFIEQFRSGGLAPEPNVP